MTSVVITRSRHPVEGHALRVLGRMHRHGRLELLLELPDGSKSLIPAAWTDLEPPAEEEGGAQAVTVGSVADLLVAVEVVSGLADRVVRADEEAAQWPIEEDAHAAEHAVEPGVRRRSHSRSIDHRPAPGQAPGGGAGVAGRSDRQGGQSSGGRAEGRGGGR